MDTINDNPYLLCSSENQHEADALSSQNNDALKDSSTGGQTTISPPCNVKSSSLESK